jgi:glutathione S-transferase
LKSVKNEKLGGLHPQAVTAEVERARVFLTEIVELMSTRNSHPEKSYWIFGGDSPTALDASLVVFLVRMQDVGRAELIPPRLRQMADVVSATPEFSSIYAPLWER